jgi:DNA polymerase-3 subunit gamma/tau
MSYEPLHHKYRPKTFAELVGQDAIATTLTNAISTAKIAPAYLFTGPRGTGKTSSARILAKSLNCVSSKVPTEKPCGVCDVCKAIAYGSALDVIEIDAASNTGVDNIRELIERAQFAPVQCRYKVYVIDECHMLSVAAFNALLKTLEEPPERVVFVLATTDPQRVLPTIISRCQRFDFRRIPLEAMVAHLSAIATKENINITQSALLLVASFAQGGLRDAESLLDQLSLLSGQVTVERVWDLVGSCSEPDLMKLLQAISQNNPEAVLDCARKLMDRGREPLTILQNLAGFYRDLLIAKTAPSRSDLVAVMPSTWKSLCEQAVFYDIHSILAGQQHLAKSEVQIKNTTQPRLWLEVTLLGLLPSANNSQQVISTQLPALSYQSVRHDVRPTTTQPGQRSEVSPEHRLAVQHQPPHLSALNNAVANNRASLAQSTPEPAASQPPSVPDPHPEASSDRSSISNPLTEVALPAATHADGVTTPLSDLEQIWQQLLEYLSKPSKALFGEHGRLLAINGQQAQIGIRSQNLVKMAQSKVADVEAAFQKVCHHKVKVSFELAAPTQTKAAPVNKLPAPGTDAAPANFPQSTEPRTNNFAANLSTQTQVLKDQPEITAGKSTAPISDSLKMEVATYTSTHTADWQDDEVAIAAQRLADFFNGEVVKLNLDSALPQSVPTNSPLPPITTPTPEWYDPDAEGEVDIEF